MNEREYGLSAVRIQPLPRRANHQRSIAPHPLRVRILRGAALQVEWAVVEIEAAAQAHLAVEQATANERRRFVPMRLQHRSQRGGAGGNALAILLHAGFERI